MRSFYLKTAKKKVEHKIKLENVYSGGIFLPFEFGVHVLHVKRLTYAVIIFCNAQRSKNTISQELFCICLVSRTKRKMKKVYFTSHRIVWHLYATVRLSMPSQTTIQINKNKRRERRRRREKCWHSHMH